jgi:hypothetical protein
VSDVNREVVIGVEDEGCAGFSETGLAVCGEFVRNFPDGSGADSFILENGEEGFVALLHGIDQEAVLADLGLVPGLRFDFAKEAIDEHEWQGASSEFAQSVFFSQLLRLEPGEFRLQFPALQEDIATLRAETFLAFPEVLAKSSGLIDRAPYIEGALLALAVDFSEFRLRDSEFPGRRGIEPVLLLLALKHPQIRFQPIHEIESKQRPDRRAKDGSRILALRQFLDLLAIEEKQIGNRYRQIGLDHLVPMGREGLVRQSIA